MPDQHRLDERPTGQLVDWDRKDPVRRTGQQLADLLKRLERRNVHIDHHLWIIDPKPLFHPPMPLEEAGDCQAGFIFSNTFAGARATRRSESGPTTE
jgi:hypothetical protein